MFLLESVLIIECAPVLLQLVSLKWKFQNICLQNPHLLWIQCFFVLQGDGWWGVVDIRVLVIRVLHVLSRVRSAALVRCSSTSTAFASLPGASGLTRTPSHAVSSCERFPKILGLAHIPVSTSSNPPVISCFPPPETLKRGLLQLLQLGVAQSRCRCRWPLLTVCVARCK